MMLDNPFLHWHNWLNGHIYARLCANGVCEVYAHHINSKFFDDGRDLDYAVPVVGIKVDNAGEHVAAARGRWDGTQTAITLGPVRFDMTLGGLLDLLDLGVDHPEALATVKKFADWLMSERYDHDGVMGWGYQHGHDGGREFFDYAHGKWIDLPGPGLWHLDYLARLMTFCSLRFNDARYFDAWAESYLAKPDARAGDHAVAQSLQYLPWVQALLWNAKLADGKIDLQPVRLGRRTPKGGTVDTSFGTLQLSWDDDGNCRAGGPAADRATVKPARHIPGHGLQ